MANVAFDLDETLGRFLTPALHLILTDLTMYYAGQGRGFQPFIPSDDLKQKMDLALTKYAECLASSEEGKKLLRPGILKIIKKISDAKDQGKIKNVVVYSNNGNLNCLKLATRMIEFLLEKPGIFCDLINFYNPIRTNGDAPNFSRPGSANKTWRVFKQLFSQECGSTEPVQAESSYFFDDVLHQDIYRNIGVSNYFNVSPYKVDISFPIVNECFETAMKSQGLDTNQEYFRYIQPITGGSVSNFRELMIYLGMLNRGVRLTNLPFRDDTQQILERLEKIFPSPPPPPAPNASNAPIVNQSRVNNSSRTVPFNVGSTASSSNSGVPFYGGKSKCRHSKRHSSKKHKKQRKGTRKN